MSRDGGICHAQFKRFASPFSKGNAWIKVGCLREHVKRTSLNKGGWGVCVMYVRMMESSNLFVNK